MDNRFSVIEMYLAYWGVLKRAYLMKHLNVGSVTASRMLSAYSKFAPNNLHYSPKRKAYIYTDRFILTMAPTPEAVLQLMCYGEEVTPVDLKVFGPQQPNFISAEIDATCCAALCRSIVQETTIQIGYTSASSGLTERVVSPVALFKSRQVWYFRAYDSRHDEFRTFRFNRVINIADADKFNTNKTINDDEEWNTEVVLSLAPHTNHPNKEALALDLGMSHAPISNIKTNAVLASFFLQELRVDCTQGAELNPMEYNLQLMNRHELTHLGILSLQTP